MTPTTRKRLDEIRERAGRATPAMAAVERICHDNGSIAYEVQDDHHLLVFYEHNHEQPMRAKFNAEFYNYAKDDIPALLAALEQAMGGLGHYSVIADRDGALGQDRRDVARKALADIDAILGSEAKE